MEHYVPISYYDYYGVDGYYYKAVVVKNGRDRSAKELYDELVHKQVAIGNVVIEVDSIEYGEWDENYHLAKEIKKNEPLILIIKNKQSLFRFTARLHPRFSRMLRRYRHNSASSVRIMLYGAVIISLISFVALIVAGLFLN